MTTNRTIMKYLILSDIHGSLPELEKVLSFFQDGGYDMLILLGDLLNYGPRNGVPKGLNAPGITERLNSLSQKIIAVRGNCDSEVDQMLLDFPCMGDYAMLVIGNRKLFLTHGHRHSPENMPKAGIDVFFYGHTHLWQLEKDMNGMIICNTGSITFPKDGRAATFATIEDDRINIRDLEGNILKSLKMD